MPTYEYECRKCGHRFEKFQAITAVPVKTCPKCRGRVARLLSGGAGIIFRGSGFYQTDYKKSPAASSGAGKGKADKPEKTAAAASKPHAARTEKSA
ncbi:MAG: zinc ribbon domain-containing protein [Opitutae bacterium]|nr:zinc ribbon domain-containing protein [Kiritimatiellia bacterium]NCC93852.1 zinc ribbon domain-containing protein [Opitutae bacterium]